MRNGTIRIVFAAAAVSLFAGSDWTHFRGNETNGVSNETNLPVHLDAEKHVAWKVPLPGRGPSGPIDSPGDNTP